jgi:fumarate hydratase subunit beta
MVLQRFDQNRDDMNEIIRIKTPLTDKTIEDLSSGTRVLIDGVLYTARDAAHQRLYQLLEQGKELPFDINGAIIYYVGPTPPKPGHVIGSAGPTSSYRMDAYTPELIRHGLRGMIGKGARDKSVKEAISKYKAVYFAATGGAGALISQSIKKSEIVAYEDLGTEAIRRLEVESFPAIVANDIFGNDLYEQGIREYRR